jgi:hypothetical protein
MPQTLVTRLAGENQLRIDDQGGAALRARSVGAAAAVAFGAWRNLGLTSLAARRTIEVQHHADLRKGDSTSVVTLARVTDKIS